MLLARWWPPSWGATCEPRQRLHPWRCCDQTYGWLSPIYIPRPSPASILVSQDAPTLHVWYLSAADTSTIKKRAVISFQKRCKKIEIQYQVNKEINSLFDAEFHTHVYGFSRFVCMSSEKPFEMSSILVSDEHCVNCIPKLEFYKLAWHEQWRSMDSISAGVGALCMACVWDQ